MMTIVPVVIMPLFNKYEDLPDGDLKTRIYELAERLKYPLTKLFVMDGSKRSSHSNAFMFGFGSNKRIGKSRGRHKRRTFSPIETALFLMLTFA